MTPKSFLKKCLTFLLFLLLTVLLCLPACGQGALTNGGNHDGAITVAGQTNSWFFTANAGDSVMLRCAELSGTATFGPLIRLYGPNNLLVSSNSHASDAYVLYRATNSGPFTLSVASGTAGQTGTYRLRFMQIPGAFQIPPGDEGGPLTSGGNYDGTNSLGDEDIWTFEAQAGQSVVVRSAKITGTGSYRSWLRLFEPGGSLVAQDNGTFEAVISYQATNTGTFTALMGSGGIGQTGSYRLGFVRVPDTVTVPPGDEGGELVNGANYTGTIPPADIDTWTFNATAGESVVLRCPATASGSWPNLRLYDPTGMLIASDNAFLGEAIITLQLTNSGKFTVLVDSFSTATMGPYGLRLVKIPEPFIIPPGDQGGALTNGAAHEGVIELGDMDLWTIPANKGETLAFRSWKLTGGSGFATYQRLYGPDGKLLVNFSDNNLDNFFTYQTTNSGTFTLLVDSYSKSYSGSYRLRVAHVPRAFVVPPGDDGGALTNAVWQEAILAPGDIDSWTFAALAGDSIRVTVTNVSWNVYTGFRVLLYKPDGALLTSRGGHPLVTVSNTAPSRGTYTVLITPGSPGGTGTYQVRRDKEPPDVIPALTLGTAATNRFTAAGDRVYYSLAVPPGGHLRFTLDDRDNLGANEIYIRRGATPSAGAYDYRFTNAGADQEILALNAEQGDWYILVVGAAVTGAGDFTLRADFFSGLVLQTLTPNQVNNLIPQTITVDGGGFDDTAQAFLKLGVSTVRTGVVSVVSRGRLLVDFNFSGVSSNIYQLTITQGTNSASLPLEMIEGVPKLETHLIVPRVIGRRTPGWLTVRYANTGNAPMPAPLLVLQASDRAAMSLDSTLGASGVWSVSKAPGFSDTIQLIASTKTPGVLQPGEEQNATIFMGGLQQPWNLADASIQFDLGVFDPSGNSAERAGVRPASVGLAAASSTSGAIDWNALKAALRPDNMDSGAWDAFWANFVAGIGPTWRDYDAMLNENVTYLSRLGLNVTDVTDLLAFELAQASGFNPVTTLSSAVDAYASGPGLDLSFTRFFPLSLTERFTVGLLGRGWSHNWAFRAQTDTNGNVTVLDPAGGQRIFQRDIRSGYFRQPGDYGTLLNLGSGRYELREKDGNKMVFRSDGLLEFMEDLNANRITAAYSGALLTSLSHSAGQSMQLAYNGNLLRSVTDSFGHVTTFAYDGAQHLTSATYDGATTIGYGYSLGQGVAREHALSSVAYPDGTHDLFTYDNRGRLTTISGDGGAGQTSFSYDTVGTVSMTDNYGNQTKFFFDHRGLPARVENPLGKSSRTTYDRNFNPTSIQGFAGTSVSLYYDAFGNLTHVFNPVGRSMAMRYAANARLVSLTDGRGDTTTFLRDSRGNITSLVYPDRSQEVYTNDVRGDVISLKNRRGQTTTTTRDALGRITRRVLPEGRTNQFTYDARGNLTRLNDSAQGTTAFEYDNRDLITRLTYGDGRGFQIAYDTGGRRTSRTSHDGYTLKYFYDTAGRLEHLEDGANRRIIQYQYDAAGRLSRENKGNGTWTTYEYDAASQLLHLVNFATNGTVVSRFDYTYDADGNRTSLTRLAGTTAFTYDANGQMTSVSYPSGRRVTYSYDSAGNRTGVTDNGTNTTYTANNLSQYTQVGPAVLKYDADGNLTNRTDAAGSTSYQYDSQNRLINVVTPSDGTWQYAYDAFGNRISVTRNGQSTRYLHDLAGLVDVAAEYDGSGALLARYDHGAGLAARTDAAGNRSYYNYDALGHTRELTDAAGNPANRYDYDPFGVPVQAQETIPNPFRYVGRFGVTTEADGLQLMRERYYSPTLGRFLSTDPIFLGDPAANNYTYAANNPLSFIDPQGTIAPVVIYGVIQGGRIAFQAGRAAWPWISRTAWPWVKETAWPVVESATTAALNWGRNVALPGLRAGGKRLLDFVEKQKESIERLHRIWEAYERAHKLKELAEKLKEQTTGQKPPPQPEQIADPLPLIPQETATSQVVTARDPNELIGPAGYGPVNYLRGDRAFAYRVNFENATNATAPAQMVVITNTIPANLDLATLEFISVGFGDRFFSIPARSQHYEHTENLTYNGSSFDVNVEAKVDTVTRQVQVKFDSIVSEIGLPPAVDVGFLPPEDGTGRGNGHVAYLVRPKTNLVTGTEIRNVGHITFDPFAGGATFRTDLVDPTNPNSGINTNRQALVTIDADSPSSSVTALPASSGTPSFTVMWSGTDVGAGVASYDIYVQTDGGAWVRWLDNTPLTSAIWNGALGRRYGFYAAANDGAGLGAAAPTGSTPSQATTTILANANFFRVVAISAQTVELEFVGAAGEVWNIQRALTVTGAWEGLGAVTVRTNGSVPFTDSRPSSGNAFYRAVR